MLQIVFGVAAGVKSRGRRRPEARPVEGAASFAARSASGRSAAAPALIAGGAAGQPRGIDGVRAAAKLTRNAKRARRNHRRC